MVDKLDELTKEDILLMSDSEIVLWTQVLQNKIAVEAARKRLLEYVELIGNGPKIVKPNFAIN